MERRDKHIFGHPQNTNTSMVLGSGFWVGAPKGPGYRFGAGPCQTSIFIRQKKKWRPQNFEFQGFRVLKSECIFIVFYSIGGSGFWVLGNFWIRIEKRNGFPKLTVFNYTLHIKNGNFKAVIALTNVPCSSIFYVCVPAADN